MKFCPACRNMLYPIDESVVDGTKTAVFSWNKCEYKEKVDDANPIVYEHILREDKVSNLANNQYLEFDETLEHFDNIVCPNSECPSKSGAKADVVAVKINEKKLIWLYKCANCKTAWEQSSRIQ
jgi:DNA-directed RNA polymerase subunit M/transcription elongation factor TFIIS